MQNLPNFPATFQTWRQITYPFIFTYYSIFSVCYCVSYHMIHKETRFNPSKHNLAAKLGANPMNTLIKNITLHLKEIPSKRCSLKADSRIKHIPASFLSLVFISFLIVILFGFPLTTSLSLFSRYGFRTSFAVFFLSVSMEGH